MKLSSMMCVSVVTLAATAFGVEDAFAVQPIDYRTGNSNTTNPAVNPASCPMGETLVANAAGKQSCVGKPTATPLNNRQNLGIENESPMPQDRRTAPSSARGYQTDDRGPFTSTAPAGTPSPADPSPPK